MSDEQNSRATILTIDDNPDNLDLLFELFKSSNYKTLAASTGENGIVYAEKALPDIHTVCIS